MPVTRVKPIRSRYPCTETPSGSVIWYSSNGIGAPVSLSINSISTQWVVSSSLAGELSGGPVFGQPMVGLPASLLLKPWLIYITPRELMQLTTIIVSEVRQFTGITKFCDLDRVWESSRSSPRVNMFHPGNMGKTTLTKG